MHFIERSKDVLRFITFLNISSTWLHYTDNALFLDQYTGLEWFTPTIIFASVAVMTPIGIIGYWLYTKERFRTAYFFILLYSTTSISSLGHYLLPGAQDMSIRMHSLIWTDGVAGLVLVGFVFWSAFRIALLKIGQRSNDAVQK